ncbi:MAG TPA: SDR family NAD(P)-dependent oxidoreductase [Anaerolineales bacterium]|nr:SDR family NAD(P)-dependent oxidoreductase [Anaerolineales bacterium]
MDNLKQLDGKTALVTGGTAGIGFYTAHALARMGAVVYVTGRDLGRGQEAERQMRAAAGHANVHFVQADASTIGGNQELARHILAQTDQLHILVNNVGGLYNDRWETDDGYEATLAMNFVGPFALTEALLPILRQSAPARIVNVTSAGYTMWKGDLFTDIQSCETYSGFDAYNRSKYLNLLWSLALARRLKGSGIVVNAIHPGTAWTPMTQSNQLRLLPANMRLFWPVFRLLQRTGSPEKVARTSIYLASAPEAATMTGQYFESSTRPKGLNPELLDQVRQERTWDLGISLVHNARTAIPLEAEPVIQSIAA